MRLGAAVVVTALGKHPVSAFMFLSAGNEMGSFDCYSVWEFSFKVTGEKQMFF